MKWREKREKNKELSLNKDLSFCPFPGFPSTGQYVVLPLCSDVLWIRSHTYHFLPANAIYQTPSREMVQFVPGASIRAYTYIVGKENSVQRGAEFSVSSPWLQLLHKERFEFA